MLLGLIFNLSSPFFPVLLEKHIDGGKSDTHFPGTEKDYNSCIYFEVFDLLVNAIKSRLINQVITSRSVASINAPVRTVESRVENNYIYIYTDFLKAFLSLNKGG